jgi:hypothetical protein
MSFTDAEMLRLLEELASAASEMLLFLQHVEKINVYVRSPTGVIAEVAKVGVRFPPGSSSVDRQLTRRYIAEHSPMLSAWLSNATDAADVDKGVSEIGIRDAASASGPPAAASRTYCFDTESERDGNVSTSRWLVHSTVEPAPPHLAVSLHTPFQWSSVAIALNTDGAAAVGNSARPLKGSCYCFLPLPIETGLPVHVHGSFVLTHNRRSLWAGGGQSGVGKDKSDWNSIVIEELLPRCYARALAQCTQHLGARGAATLFDVWPCEMAIQAPFAPLLTGLAEQIVTGGYKLFHEPVNGIWHGIGKVRLQFIARRL